MKFTISPTLLQKLQDRTAGREKTDIELSHDAFLLFPGMGPALFLTSDGRVFKDSRDWDESIPIEEGSDDDAVAALVIGAENLDLPDLLELLPKPTPGSIPCSLCKGTRWFSFNDYYGKPAKILCSECRGRGYTASTQ